MTVPAVRSGPAEPPPTSGAHDDVPEVPLRGGSVATIAAVGAWSTLIAVAWRVGEPHRAEWKLRAAPLAGFFDRHLSPATLVVLALGLALVVGLPRWCERLGWRRVLVLSALVAAAWGSALGLTRGIDGLERGVASVHEYTAVVPRVEGIGLGRFVETFDEEPVLRRYPIHVQGHPVGAPLLYVGLDRLGLGGTGWAAAATIALGATAVPAVLIAVRSLAGEARARRAAPFLALAPAAVWAVASADAVFAAVGAWTVVALVAATDAPPGSTRARAAAIGGGLLGGIALHLSYGLVLLAVVALAPVLRRRRWEVIGWATAGGAVVVLGAVLSGFWWLDGLEATRIRYEEGIAEFRPFRYFAALGNPAALAIAAGPALAVALVRVRDRALWWVAGPAVAAVVLADLSGMSKGEVERIWLPFLPWALVLAAGLAVPSSEGSRSWPRLATGLLAAQVALAVAVESVVKTPW